jgi:ankyrin repeat protein
MLAEDNRQNFSPPLRQATTKKVQAMEARMIESVHQDDNTVLDSGLSNEPGSLIVKDDDGDARILFTNPNEKHVDRALEQALETAPKTDSADSFEEEVEVAESFSGVEKHAPGDKKQNQSEELQHDPALPIDNSHDPKLQLEFMMAVIDGDHESLKSILHEYRDRIDIDEVDGEGQSSLGTAVSFDYVATAKILIDARANLDIANKTGFTPLGHAQKNGNLELMQALLDAGADKLPKQLPHWPTYGPATYLAQAVMQGRRDIVQILLNHKVDVNDPTHLYKARMPLVQVCERSQDLILVRMLLNAGADVNCGHGNCPPLFPAAMHSFPDLFRVLLEAGADPDLVPKNWGRTSPRSLCEGKDELKKILMRHELKKTLCGKTRS